MLSWEKRDDKEKGEELSSRPATYSSCWFNLFIYFSLHIHDQRFVINLNELLLARNVENQWLRCRRHRCITLKNAERNTAGSSHCANKTGGIKHEIKYGWKSNAASSVIGNHLFISQTVSQTIVWLFFFLLLFRIFFISAEK